MNKERDLRPEPLTFEAINQAAAELLLRDGYHLPTLIVEGHQKTAFIKIAQMASSHRERAEQMFFIGSALSHQQAVGALKQVFFITEAWLSKQLEVSPSQDPRRVEVLAISNYQPDKEKTRLAVFEILRDAAGELREIRPYEHREGEVGHAESPLLDAFVSGFEKGAST